MRITFPSSGGVAKILHFCRGGLSGVVYAGFYSVAQGLSYLSAITTQLHCKHTVITPQPPRLSGTPPEEGNITH